MNSIKQYIRNEKGEKIGVMVAEAIGADSYGIGYSVARPDSPDKFDEELGMVIATNRSRNMGVNSKIVYGDALGHTQFRDDLVKFADRAGRFFQGRDVLANTEEKVLV